MTRSLVGSFALVRRGAPAGFAFFLVLGIGAGWSAAANAETCAGGVTNYCCDGNTPTLGVCGNVGQRICLVDTPLNFSDCASICAPGLVYNSATAHCEKPCSYCSDVGFCCGDIGQTACLLGSTGPDSCGVGSINLGCKAGLHFGLSLLCEPPAVPEQTFLNGSNPRPFYIWGHNPNTFAKIDADLAAGANALEPDITTATDGPCDTSTTGDLVDSDSSSPYRGGLCYDTHFTDWLDHVEGIVAAGDSGLALIAFDIKTSVAEGKDLKRILTAIRDHLTSKVALKVILSVGSLADAATAFGSTDFTAADLQPAEGVMIDGEDDAAAVSTFFLNHSYVNFAYGDGTAVNALDVSAHGVQLRAQDKAAFLRASQANPKILSYAYLLNARPEMNAFINSGVDGIIPGSIDSAIPIVDAGCETYYGTASHVACDITHVLSCGKGEFCAPSGGSATAGICQNNVTALLACAHSPNPSASLDVDEIGILASVVTAHPEIRLAGPLDNPFLPALQSYGLKMTTGDNGTDADLTFTITGCKGSAKGTVNSGYVVDPTYNSGRMESGTTDFVTIPSKDLGPLKSINIYNDGTGLDPEWNFTSLQVDSAGWRHAVGSSEADYQVAAGTHTLPRWQSLTLPLTSAESGGAITVPVLPDVIAQCYAALPAAPIAQDGCNSPIIGTTLAPLFFKQGDFTILWTFADTFGNSTTGSEAVHVHDTIAPVISGLPTALTVGTGPGRTTCDQVATWAAPTVTDNCAVASDVATHLSGEVFPLGATTVSYTAKDAVDNTTVVSFPVVVVDDTPPIISCPASIVSDASTAAGTAITFAATATDNCAPPPAIAYSQNPGTTFPIGTTTVTPTATDHAGNQSSCSFTVTVRGPRAIEQDLLAELQALLPTLTDKHEAKSLSDAIDAVIESNAPALWIDDAHLQLATGTQVFDQKRKAVQKLAELMRKDAALGPSLSPLIAREVLAARILVEVVLPGATGEALAQAQRALAAGDVAAAAGAPDKAIGNFGTAWKAAAH